MDSASLIAAAAAVPRQLNRSLIAVRLAVREPQSGRSSLRRRGRSVSRGHLVRHADAMAIDHFPAFPASKQEDADHDERENHAINMQLGPDGEEVLPNNGTEKNPAR